MNRAFPEFHILGTTERKKRAPTQVNDALRAQVRASGFGRDYWDDPDFPGHQGYVYDGRWRGPAKELIDHYKLSDGSSVLDVGCAKGYLLYELGRCLPGLSLSGLDISHYALENGKEEVRDRLVHGSADSLPFEDKSFDLVVSLATVYFLEEADCGRALREIERVGREKLIQVVSYRNEQERENMLRYDLGCLHKSQDEWIAFLEEEGYTGQVSWFIFVE